MVQLVGILNVTPDSFSDGGLFLDPQIAIKQARRLFADGARIVDIGAESTRPGAVPLTPDEEWQRLEPVLSALLSEYPRGVSIDSYHPETVERAFAIGPIIVNDVTGLNNPTMAAVVAKLKPRIIVSHLPGSDIQQAHRLAPVTSVAEVKRDLLAKAQLLLDKGLHQEDIVLDPGIGFGKTPELNWQLLRFAEQVPEFVVMIGYSRKRFLGNHRMELEPNLEAGKIAVASGAAFLRVHDVAGHRQLLA